MNAKSFLYHGIWICLTFIFTLNSYAGDNPQTVLSIARYEIVSSVDNGNTKEQTVKIVFKNNTSLNNLYNGRVLLQSVPSHVTADKKELYVGNIAASSEVSTVDAITLSIRTYSDSKTIPPIKLVWEVLYQDNSGEINECQIVDTGFPTR